MKSRFLLVALVIFVGLGCRVQAVDDDSVGDDAGDDAAKMRKLLDALEGLDQLLLKPQLFADDSVAWLQLSALYSLLARNQDAAAVPEAQERMWQLALRLEEGRTEQTARALEEARRAVREANPQWPTDPETVARDRRAAELGERRGDVGEHPFDGFRAVQNHADMVEQLSDGRLIRG